MSRRSSVTEPRPLPQILAPVDRVDEVPALAEARAGVLYGGIQPPGWGSAGVSATQRTFSDAHFADEGALIEAVAEARCRRLGFQLTLNSPSYPHEKVHELVDLAERMVACGATGVIAADLALLQGLARADLGADLTLSTLAGATNHHAVAFYRPYGITRVVVPRHLSLAETASLTAAHPTLAFEAFVLVGRCPNEEALCSFQHVSPSKRWPCEVPYELTDLEGDPLPPGHPVGLWQTGWDGADRRFGCGLCAMEGLVEAGVAGLKVVGRGGPTRAKVANVAAVAAALEAADGKDGPARFEARFGRPCHPLECYYPEVRPERL